MKGFDLRRIQGLAARGFLNWMPDGVYLRILYKARTGKKLNLQNPQTFNEKLQWLKLYDRRPEYTTMVDKYEVKKYIAELIGQEHIIPTLGVWDRFEDINFQSLPQQFVLKCSHDSGGLVIVRDKSRLDYETARARINHSLKCDYFWTNREWPYKNVKPRIIAEKYMVDESGYERKEKNGLTDYKVYCFDGEPKFLYISQGLENHATASISFLTLDWQFAPYERNDYKPFSQIPSKPAGYEEMLELSRELSKGIPFLRVDLYQIGQMVYFSELTFTPCSGFIPFRNEMHDIEIGKMLQLPLKNAAGTRE